MRKLSVDSLPEIHEHAKGSLNITRVDPKEFVRDVTVTTHLGGIRAKKTWVGLSDVVEDKVWLIYSMNGSSLIGLNLRASCFQEREDGLVVYECST